jgi:hypothetical protein
MSTDLGDGFSSYMIEHGVPKTVKREPVYNRNPDGSFMSSSEIVEDIVTKDRLDEETVRILSFNFNPPLTNEEKLQIAETYFDPNVFTRSQLGRWIRNSYGLWAEDNPHTTLKWDQKRHVRDGVDHSPYHPDNYSDAIIDRLVRFFHGERLAKLCEERRDDGPTPCRWPDCGCDPEGAERLSEIETVSLEFPPRRLPYDWNNGVIKRWSIFRRVAHWFRTGQWL